jgi:actin-related protein
MKPLIIDIGSYALKVGFGGEFAPRLDIPMIAGKVKPNLDYTRRKNLFTELNIPEKQEYFFGHEAMYLRHILDVEWVCNGRTILDEFFFLKLLVYAMDVLKISPTNQTILLTQPFYSEFGNFLGNKLFSAYNVYEIIPTFQPLLNCLGGSIPGWSLI